MDQPIWQPQPTAQPPMQPPVEPKHSGLGIASFIISILSGILMCLAIGGATAAAYSASGGVQGNTSLLAALGLSMFCLLFACVVSLGLGIGALFQKNRKKIFAILGVVFAIVVILGWVALEIIGLTRG